MRLRWAAAIAARMRAGTRGTATILAASVAIAGCMQVAPPLAEPVPFKGVGYIIINAEIGPQTRDLFIKDVDQLRAAGAKEIDIGMNSPGGVMQSAGDIVDYMQRQHRDAGMTFKAYNMGLVASAATYIFLNAQDRYSIPRGVFLFHAAGVMANGMITGEMLRESAATLDVYEQKIRTTLVSRTHLTDSEAQTYVRRTVLLSADDARRDGVVDGIAAMQVPPGVRGYLIASRPAAARRPATAFETPAGGR